MPILRGMSLSVGLLKAGPETEVAPATAFELNTLDASEPVFPPLILTRKGVLRQAQVVFALITSPYRVSAAAAWPPRGVEPSCDGDCRSRVGDAGEILPWQCPLLKIGDATRLLQFHQCVSNRFRGDAQYWTRIHRQLDARLAKHVKRRVGLVRRNNAHCGAVGCLDDRWCLPYGRTRDEYDVSPSLRIRRHAFECPVE